MVIPGSTVKYRFKDKYDQWNVASRWHIVDTIVGSTANIFLDDRTHPARVKCDMKDIVSHGCRRERVFSIDAVAITIRNFGLPFAMNGMLVLDDRFGCDSVRRLLGDELSAIQEVTHWKFKWLRDNGVSDLQVGKYAGNSIPQSMARLPVEDLVQMIEMVDEMQNYGDLFGMPVMHARAPAAVPREGLQKLILVPVSVTSQQAWFPDLDDTVWGIVVSNLLTQGSARSKMTKLVESWLRHTGLVSETRVEHAAKWKVGGVNMHQSVGVAE